MLFPAYLLHRFLLSPALIKEVAVPDQEDKRAINEDAPGKPPNYPEQHSHFHV
jgi:hypothetical protein